MESYVFQGRRVVRAGFGFGQGQKKTTPKWRSFSSNEEGYFLEECSQGVCNAWIRGFQQIHRLLVAWLRLWSEFLSW